MSNSALPSAIAARPDGAASRSRNAIAWGAQATGTDFSYLLAQAKLESGLDPAARARTSSATGLYQFIESTWLATLAKHGTAHGLDQFAAQIERSGGRYVVRDPVLRGQIMALRQDPAAAAVMAGALAQDNRAALIPVLGREPDAAELYLAHFLGAGGATSFLRAMQSDPAASAAALLPDAAAANRAIFYAGGVPRSLAEVMDLLRTKVAGAMEDGGVPPARPMAGGAAWFAGSTAAPGIGVVPQRAASSMSQTLETSFGLSARGGSGFAPPGHVRAAYGKLKAFAL